MVKINLLDIPEEQQPSSRPQQNEPDPSDAGGAMDFSFFQEEDEQQPQELEQPQEQQQTSYFEQVEDTADQTYQYSDQEEYQGGFGETGAGYDSGVPKSRIFILAGAVILLVVALLAYLYFSKDQDTTPDFITANPTVEQTTPTTAAQQPQSSVPGYLQTRYSSNQAENRAHLSQADNILNTSTANTDYTLAVFTPGYIYLSVLGDSRDAIAQYRNQMKAKIPQLNLTSEGTEDKFAGGEKKLLANFSIVTGGNPSQGRSSGQFQDIISVQDAQAAVRSTAQKHQLRTTYFKAGKQEIDGNFRKTYLYTRVSGNRAKIISYLQELSEQYPAIYFAKVSMYPPQSGTMSGGNIFAHVEMAVFGPR